MEHHWQVINSGAVVVSNSPEELWEQACEYFSWCDNHPIKNTSTLKSGREAGKQITTTSQRPYTVKGLCLHCGIVQEYLSSIKASKNDTSVYYQVVTRIEYIIHTQNIELATVGVFNPIFVSKVLNMDNEEAASSPVRVEFVGGLPQLATSEKQILEKLDFENGNMEEDESEKS